MLRRALDPEEVDLGAEREHQVVVRERRHLGELHLALGKVDSGHGRLVDGDVRLLVKQVAHRMSDGRGLEQVGGELVQERLERVVVVLVHEHDVDVGVLQLPRGADAGEAAAQDEDTVGDARGCVLICRPSRLPGGDARCPAIVLGRRVILSPPPVPASS